MARTQEKLHEAFGRFNVRDFAGAERLCMEILAEDPHESGALHLSGLVQLTQGNPREAITLINRALKHGRPDAMVVEHLGIACLAAGDYRKAEDAFRRAMKLGAAHGLVHMRLGMALGSQGRLTEALDAMQTAAERAPEDPDVHLNLGNLLAGQGRSDEALACFERAVALRPDYLDAHYNIGTLLKQMGRLGEAIAAYQRVLARAPSHADALNNLGIVYEQAGRMEEALACYRKVLAVAPRHVHAHSNLGNALRAQGQLEAAAASCEAALAIRPDFADALINLGNVRVEQGRFGEAQELYEQALKLEPRSVEAFHSLGALLRTQGRIREAVDLCRRAAEARADPAAIQMDLGSAFRDGGEIEGAIAAFEKAAALDPRSYQAHYNLADALKIPGRFDEAIDAYQRTLALKPDHFPALTGLIYLRQHVCDWSGIESLWERLRREAIGKPGSGVSPFSVLNMPFSAEEQLACAREWARHRLDRLTAARSALGFTLAPRAPHARLRVGYLSWDFHQHATSYLIAETFELHDRSRFEVFAYSYGPDDGSPIRARIRSAVEHFVDVAGESFVENARRIARDEIDILVDLKGYTLGARPQIVALRPAPVQVLWLGYPSTMGTGCVDYFLADSFVVPEGAERWYTEQVVRLPLCYMVNDRKREIAQHTPAREECGLPGGGTVFCCFNQTGKILPDVFALWMRVLKAVPGSVLWLLESNRWATENLRRAAAEHGIEPGRLVFGPRKPMAEHLARYRLADLALDTFPYGSHTTASDALWAGCPLVTYAGTTFVSRVAGSMLTSVGMPELISGSLAQYERLAIELALDPAKLRGVRRRLQEVRTTCLLFDTPRFVTHLEAAYQKMFEAWARGDSSSPRATGAGAAS